MGLLELSMIGFGLSMDAFAVAVSRGLILKKMQWKIAIIIGTYFGLFQAIMPLLGYISGIKFGELISKYSGLITFVLLLLIGMNMIKESFSNKDKKMDNNIGFIYMISLALATSIDAFAIGITFSFLKINILEAIFIIGIITFIVSIFGVKIGNEFGNKYEKSAQIIGGMILIVIGLKSLLKFIGIF